MFEQQVLPIAKIRIFNFFIQGDMNNYNKIYNDITHLEYTVDTENISLICIIEKSKKN